MRKLVMEIGSLEDVVRVMEGECRTLKGKVLDLIHRACKIARRNPTKVSTKEQARLEERCQSLARQYQQEEADWLAQLTSHPKKKVGVKGEEEEEADAAQPSAEWLKKQGVDLEAWGLGGEASHSTNPGAQIEVLVAQLTQPA